MAQVVNTNVMSLNAQRNLMMSQRTQNEAMSRLSSGLRINNASDDAAGLSIGSNMTAQIRGVDMAAKNSNDAISMTQVAEGAMQESTSILQRMRELAVQSANGSNSDANRAQLQDEVNSLQSELTRIANTTEFNGIKLLDGSFSSRSFQIGANAGVSLDVSVSSVRAADLQRYSAQMSSAGGATGAAGSGGAGGVTAAGGLSAGNNIASQDLTIAGYRGTARIDSTANGGLFAADATAEEIAAAVNERTAETGVTARAETVAYISLRGSSGATGALSTGAVANTATVLSFNLAAGNSTVRDERLDAGLTLDKNANGVVEITGTVTTTGDMTAVAESVNKQSGVTGITASLSEDRTYIKLTNSEGKDIDISNATFSNLTAGTMTVMGSIAQERDDDNELSMQFDVGADIGRTTGAIVAGKVEFESIRAFSVTSSVDQATGVVTNTAGGLGVTANSDSVSDVNISSAQGATDAIKTLDKAIAYVDDQRAGIGATQNRLNSTINNLTSISVNTASARSQIQDADFAAESAKLSKAQVLQQAGTAMLAQANAAGQSVLSLLQ